jgi:hypothetical protein
MAARTGVQYLVEEVRRLTGAGTAEFTVGTVTYFSDDEIERLLDRRRARLARNEVVFEYELASDGSGSTVYKNGRIGYPWLEDVSSGTVDFIVTTDKGSVIGTANYTLSPEDGFITFSADQAGSSRYVTGWVHNPHQAAMDVLVSWKAQLAMQPDWETDNMKVKRSQKADAVDGQIEWLKKLGGWAPELKVTMMDRPDDQIGGW